MKEYILIKQDKAQVEIFLKDGESWKIERITGIENEIEIKSLAIKIELLEIFRDVELE